MSAYAQKYHVDWPTQLLAFHVHDMYLSVFVVSFTCLSVAPVCLSGPSVLSEHARLHDNNVSGELRWGEEGDSRGWVCGVAGEMNE